ncbi:MAG: hypothetical protein AAGA68_23210 [Pseudomonadota bacterium]
MSRTEPRNNNQDGQVRFTRKTVVFIILAGAVCASGVAVQQFFSTRGDTALASGAIVPLASVWFVISNWYCANASFLYGRHHLPLWFIVLGWFGLAGGGTDHLIELYSYLRGDHQPFAEHWVDMHLFGIPMVWFPFVAFGVTSLMGIWGMVYVFIRNAPNASLGAKCLFGVWALLGGLWGIGFEPALVQHSTISWYVTHTFITHALLSMLPVYIVWLYASHINVFSLIPRPSQGVGISPPASAVAR